MKHSSLILTPLKRSICNKSQSGNKKGKIQSSKSAPARAKLMNCSKNGKFTLKQCSLCSSEGSDHTRGMANLQPISKNHGIGLKYLQSFYNIMLYRLRNQERVRVMYFIAGDNIYCVRQDFVEQIK